MLHVQEIVDKLSDVGNTTFWRLPYLVPILSTMILSVVHYLDTSINRLKVEVQAFHNSGRKTSTLCRHTI